MCVLNKESKKKKTHHGLGLGIKRSDKVGRVLLLEPDTRSESMTRIILEDTAGGVVDQHKALVSAYVSQSECPNNVGSNGLDLVGFTPVHVWSARDAGRVEDMARLHGCDVGFE